MNIATETLLPPLSPPPSGAMQAKLSLQLQSQLALGLGEGTELTYGLLCTEWLSAHQQHLHWLVPLLCPGSKLCWTAGEGRGEEGEVHCRLLCNTKIHTSKICITISMLIVCALCISECKCVSLPLKVNAANVH